MSETVSAMWAPQYASRAERMKASEIRELLKLLDQPGIISFAGGIPSPTLFPAADFASAYAAALASPEAASIALQYSVSEGHPELIRWIARHMNSLGVPACPENIVITSGSQQALDFLGKLLLSPGDTVLVEKPTYLGALQAFSAYEPRYDTLPQMGANPTPDVYRTAAHAAGGVVKFAYAVPDFANPTGETMNRTRREGLLALADELDVPLLEDSAYSALRFDGAPLPALQALDVARKGGLDASRVVYLGTFSKTIAPGLRIGWVCAAREIIKRLVLIKQASDLNAPVINQIAMLRVADRQYGDLVKNAIEEYRVKRNTMLAALETYMPGVMRWTRPEGGLFIWLTLPEGISGTDLLQRAVAETGVAFVPGAAFFHDGSSANTVRLSYSLPAPDRITEGIRRLSTLL